MTNSNTALQSIALINEVNAVYETASGYYCAEIPVGNVDETVQALTIGDLYLRVMALIEDQQTLTYEDEAMLQGLIQDSQRDALTRVA